MCDIWNLKVVRAIATDYFMSRGIGEDVLTIIIKINRFLVTEKHIALN